MRRYTEFRPTQFNSAGLALDDRQDWFVAPCGRNRDSDCITESNFHSALSSLGGEGDDVEVHRFGHWACGWFEIIIVRPDCAAYNKACVIENKLDDYPILDEEDLSEHEQAAANETWRHCFTVRERIEYIRENRSQFAFRSFEDMLGCVRGNYFAGYASELLSWT